MAQEAPNNDGIYVTAPAGATGNYALIGCSPPPINLIVFKGDDGPLVTIRRDCTVAIAEGATLDEASRLFWEQISIEGRTLRQRAEAAEERVRELEGQAGE